MKIAFVTNTCWNVFNFREGLVKFFLDCGDEVVSLSPADKYTCEIEKWGVKHIHTPLDQTGANPLRDFKYFYSLRKHLIAEAPDVILCFTIKSNIYGSLAGKILGIPTICNVSGLGTVFLIESWVGKFALALYRLAFRYSSFVFFQNKDDKELFLSNVKLDLNKVGLLPGSGINLDRFKYIEPHISNPTKFLMVARVIEEKGVREFVGAARILKGKDASAEFTLVGKIDEAHARGIPKNEIDLWIDEGVINYLGHVDKIDELIEKHEVVVLPSYREGTPRTMLEGAALGRPLIASNVAGCKEVIEDGKNGFLVEVKNAASLADKMALYMALNLEERLNFSKNSRELVEDRFGENLVIGKYTETIAQIVDK